MFYRFFLLITFSLFILTVPASALNSVSSPDAALVDAATKLLDKEYRGALYSAIKAPDSGMRDFLIGMIQGKMGEWDDSARYLGKASETFPLLADFAMFNQAYALSRLSKYPDAFSILQVMLKRYPDSPLVRTAMKLRGDVLYDGGDFRGALGAYGEFIEKYPSGADSLDSLYRIAGCRERLGETEAAFSVLRGIWLKYPASSVAEKAEKDLLTFAESGANIPPYTPEEMIGRGTVLYDLGKYERAEEAFTAVPQDKLARDVRYRLIMKIGQSRYRARKYKSAEETFRALLSMDPRADETIFWLAKTLDRSGRDDDAFSAYMGLVESSPGSNLADDSLLAAYFIKKFQNRGDEFLTLLRRLENDYPRSTLLRTACWEIAWQSYERGDFTTAAGYFKKVLDDRSRREKALYWYSRTLAATGDKEGEEKALASLAAEYPFGFYALTLAKNSPVRVEGILAPGEDIRSLVPEPSGFERAKALINLGLYDDAGKELAWLKRKHSNENGALSSIARLYLKMDDFHGSSTKVRTEALCSMDRHFLAEWGMAYPLAYREHVAANAIKNGMDEEIVYSVMKAESNFSPRAVSPSGAVGLMQIMPATARAIVTAETGKGYEIRELLRRPEINIHLGVKHLRGLLDLYNGDLVLSVAAYNAGSGNVNRWLKRTGKLPIGLFIENIPFPETREYVKKVLAGVEIYKRIYNSAATEPPLP